MTKNPAKSAHKTSAIWGAILVVIGIDATWMKLSAISADPGGLAVLVFAVGMLIAVAYFYYRTKRADPIMRAANAAAQLVTFTAAAAALSYLVTATNAPLADSALAAADSAIGFEWHSWAAWVLAHPLVHVTFVLAYGSLLYQLVACVLFLALRSSADEFLWILIVSGLLTIAISGFVPAIGNLADAPHIPHFTALRAGTLHTIPIGRGSQGLIAFPSFHTTLAIIVAYAVREIRWLFVVACVLNLLVILSVPTEGGHYLVDVFAGAALGALAIWAMSALRRGADLPDFDTT